MLSQQRIFFKSEQVTMFRERLPKAQQQQGAAARLLATSPTPRNAHRWSRDLRQLFDGRRFCQALLDVVFYKAFGRHCGRLSFSRIARFSSSAARSARTCSVLQQRQSVGGRDSSEARYSTRAARHACKVAYAPFICTRVLNILSVARFISILQKFHSSRFSF